VREPGTRLIAGEVVVRVGLHMRLCTDQDFARLARRRVMSCEGQDIQAAIPLTDINEKRKNQDEETSAYRKVRHL
jgi:hypothetical protein